MRFAAWYIRRRRLLSVLSIRTGMPLRAQRSAPPSGCPGKFQQSLPPALGEDNHPVIRAGEAQLHQVTVEFCLRLCFCSRPSPASVLSHDISLAAKPSLLGVLRCGSGVNDLAGRYFRWYWERLSPLGYLAYRYVIAQMSVSDAAQYRHVDHSCLLTLK